MGLALREFQLILVPLVRVEPVAAVVTRIAEPRKENARRPCGRGRVNHRE